LPLWHTGEVEGYVGVLVGKNMEVRLANVGCTAISVVTVENAGGLDCALLTIEIG
jgi:hypothetical protein